MGDFEIDTRVEGGDGRYFCSLSPDFVTPGGPFGGYLAALCLRVAGEHSAMPRPASFNCQFLNVADIDHVDFYVTTMRSSKRAQAIRVAMLQGEKPIVDATVWTVSELSGVDHGPHEVPSAPPPETLRSFAELFEDQQSSVFNRCMEGRPVFRFALDGWWPRTPPPWSQEDMQRNNTPQPPVTMGWVRLLPRSTFDDPYVDAARTFIPLDWLPIGAASMPMSGGQRVFFPSFDFSVSFHDSSPESVWMYGEAKSSISKDGVTHAEGKVWSEDGKLLATGMQQMFQRVFPPPPAG